MHYFLPSRWLKRTQSVQLQRVNDRALPMSKNVYATDLIQFAEPSKCGLSKLPKELGKVQGFFMQAGPGLFAGPE